MSTRKPWSKAFSPDTELARIAQALGVSTVPELAQKCGFSRKRVQNWKDLGGKVPPSALIEIATSQNLDVRQLREVVWGDSAVRLSSGAGPDIVAAAKSDNVAVFVTLPISIDEERSVPKAEQPPACYEASAQQTALRRVTDATRLIVTMQQQTGFDPGPAWMSMLQEAAWHGAPEALIRRMIDALRNGLMEER